MACGFGGLKIPRTGLEAIGRGRERTHRANLHGVAAEVRRKWFIGEGVDFGVVAAMNEVNERITSNVFGKARAAIAEDATFAIKQNKIANRNWLFVVSLLFNEATLARPISHRLILERTFAALIANRTIERVVREEELKNTVLSLLCYCRFGVGFHPRRALDHAAGLKRRTATGIDLDQTHAAHADRLHTLVVTEARDVRTRALGSVDKEFALTSDDLDAIDFHGDAVDCGHVRISHAKTPS